jgi:ankyrin repeat protein
MFRAAESLLERGAQIDLRDDMGRSLVSKLVLGNRVPLDFVKFVLEKGADVDLLDGEGRSALTWASRNGENEVVKLVLDYGAQVDLQDDKGQFALMHATQCKNIAIIYLLLKFGARVDLVCSHYKQSVFMEASDEGRLSCCLRKGPTVMSRVRVL